MYQVYGYTYKDAVYYPEKIAELLEQQLLVAVVAVSPEGDIVGHQGLLKPRPDAATAEITMGVVHPRYRGRGLFERLKEQAFAQLKAAGLPGLFGEAVCNHPYSQKANFAMGGRPSGFMLGFVPGDRVFAKLEEGSTKRDRVTVVLFHTRLNQTPSQRVYPPPQHRGIIERTYAACGVARELAVAPSVKGREGISGNVTMRTVPENSVAYLDVITIGENVEPLVRGMLRELRLMRFDCIYLDLPLSDPLTASVCAGMELLGFFYAGIIPDYLPSGDALRLQYLNNVSIDPEQVVIVGDFGRELFGYITNEWQRVL
jgi:serine/threonine-protein kinase RsbW